LYVWGYSENGSTNKAFRNGELRWADFVAFSRGPGFRSYNDEFFWQTGCDQVWYGQVDSSKGGWIYSGEYQVGVGPNFYVDKGDASTTPVPVNRFTPNPTPTPVKITNGTWYEPKYGFSGEEWCAVGPTGCDTGWVGGPTVEVACAGNQRVKNTGDFYYRWDGLKRFVGRTTCE
jgi:hypothetical protein